MLICSPFLKREMAVPGSPNDERLAYVNPAFVSDLYYYETGSAEAVPEAPASQNNAEAASSTTTTSNSDTKSAATTAAAKPALSSAVVAAAILEKQTSFKELSEKLSCAAVSGQPCAGSGKEKAAEDSSGSKPTAPDGGCLAWAIVAASFMVSFLQVSLVKNSQQLKIGLGCNAA
jgi:hypothetical protein